MIDYNAGKRKLRQALTQFTLDYYREDEDDTVVTVPSLRALSQRTADNGWFYNRVRLIGRQVAMFVAALLLIVLMDTPIAAATDVTPEFMWHESEETITVFYSDKDKSKYERPLRPVSAPGYIPRGYWLNYERREESKYVRVYENAQGNVLELVQQPLQHDRTIERDSLAVSVFYRDGQRILLGREEMRTVCVWGNGEAIFTLTAYGDIDTEEALKIVDQYESEEKTILIWRK